MASKATIKIEGKVYPIENGHVTVKGKTFAVIDEGSEDWKTTWRKIRRNNAREAFMKGKQQ